MNTYDTGKMTAVCTESMMGPRETLLLKNGQHVLRIEKDVMWEPVYQEDEDDDGGAAAVYEVLPQIHKDLTRKGILYMNHFPHECDNVEWVTKLVNCLRQLGPAMDLVQVVLANFTSTTGPAQCVTEYGERGVAMDPHRILKQLTKERKMRFVRHTNCKTMHLL